MPRERAFEKTKPGNVFGHRRKQLKMLRAGRVLLRHTATTHMDFSGLQVLSDKTEPELGHRTNTLSLIRIYTLAFFDSSLRGTHPAVLAQHPTSELIEAIERFRSAGHPQSRR